jgi:hypothetical protein
VAGLPHNVIFLIALLVIMAALVIGTFVFITIVDRSLAREDREQEQRDATDNEEGA